MGLAPSIGGTGSAPTIISCSTLCVMKRLEKGKRHAKHTQTNGNREEHREERGSIAEKTTLSQKITHTHTHT